MGVEYKIRCDVARVATVEGGLDAFIRHSHFFQSYDEHYHLYNLRLSGPEKTWDGPDACVALEEDGIYFLDNLSSKSEVAQIFRAFVDKVLSVSQSVTIAET